MRDHADNVVVICSIENFDADGRAHRRLDHRRARADAHRRRVPAHARRRVRVHPPHRRRHRRVEHPVRGEPGERRHGRHRDEPARVALERAREQGDRLPDREDRGEARGRATGSTRSRTTSPARRRRRFEPTIDYVVTKVPRWAFEKLPGASPVLGTHDAVGRRGDGDRAHVPRVAAEGAALARDRARSGSTAIPAERELRRARRRRARARGARCPRPSGSFQLEAALRRGVVGRARSHEATGIDPWFLDQILADRRRARRGSTSVGLDDA